MIRILRFFTFILAALSMGMHLAHALELGPKLQWEPDLYIAVQTSLYTAYGTIGPVLEVGALISASVLAYLLRSHQPAFGHTLISVGAIVLSLAVWLVFVREANGHISAWQTSQVTPSDWTRWRDQWQYAQTATFVLHLIGLSALLRSILLETPES